MTGGIKRGIIDKLSHERDKAKGKAQAAQRAPEKPDRFFGKEEQPSERAKCNGNGARSKKRELRDDV